MTSKSKLKKALQLIEDVLLEGDIVDDNDALEEVVNLLEDVIDINEEN
jgi:hypothetical protein